MTDFIARYQGPFKGVLRWHQLDKLWRTVRDNAESGWYIYAVGRDLPLEPVSKTELAHFLGNTDQFLRELHDEEYCGVVYTDDFDTPSLIKIYHPKNLGASCGSSGQTILPAWTLSTQPPSDLLGWVAEKEKKPAWWKQMMSGLQRGG